ncbi:hypothetical protein POM88_018245 [Heracleum sosnowskyi]|uniref:Splicing factor cactin central domain-containing protein n=1 Tax=Heracleum sosnowskyi TaxID=360622 RepID=A0AAD8IQ64_9APIA|nr:hypothetical protein POM88_018245 [Heracleum sosnowskyi]
MHLDEPSLAFESLVLKVMEELRKDIVMHLDLDSATPTRIRYWEALQVVFDWELAEARKREDLDKDRVCRDQPSEDRGLDSSIEADVKNLLQGKSLSKLEDYRSLSCQELDACFDGKHDQIESEEAEQIGLSYSPELLHGESETEEAIGTEEDKAIVQRNMWLRWKSTARG